MSAEDEKTILDARTAKTGVAVRMPKAEELMTPEERARVQEVVKPASGADSMGSAFGAGAAESIPFLNKGLAAASAVGEALGGEGDFYTRYQRNRLMQENLAEGLQQENPGSFLAGEIGGAMTMPTGVEGAMVKGGQAAYRAARLAGETPEAARLLAITPARLRGAGRQAAESAAYGGALGASEAESPDAIIPNMLTGAGIGGLTGGALGLAPFAAKPLGQAAEAVGSKFGAAGRRGVDQIDIDASRAAQDLGINVPESVVGGPEARGRAAGLIQKGETKLTEATQTMLDESEAALGRIAGDVGKPLEDVALGETAKRGGRVASRYGKWRIGNIYKKAGEGAQGVPIPAKETLTTLDQIARTEAEAIGGSKIGDKFTEMAKEVIEKQGGMLSVEGARKTRTNLRDGLMNELGLTKSNATRLTNVVMGSLTNDMEAGLRAAGKEDVFKLFKKADNEWRQMMELEDKVLEPIIGKEGKNFGDDIAKAISTHAQGKGGGMRLAKFLNSIPEERANDIRASLIKRLGLASEGNQGAAGDTFSMDNLLTNWNKMKGRNLVFPKETVDSLDKLAKVAEAAKRANKPVKGSQTAGLVAQLAGGAVPAVAGFGLGNQAFDSGWGGVAGSILLPLLSKGRSMRAAKLLASPKFAQKLARTPPNRAAAREFWSRAWVNQIAKTNPEIGNEILGFREDVLNALGGGGEQQGVEAPQ